MLEYECGSIALIKTTDRKMFSDDFVMDVDDSSEAKKIPARPRSPPPRSYEEWMSREGITQWPLVRPRSAEDSIPPESVLGTLEDIQEDLKTHAREDHYSNSLNSSCRCS